MGLDRPTGGSVSVNGRPFAEHSNPLCSAAWPTKDAPSFSLSHLMSEMALTTDHVIVVGKGRLLRDQSMADCIADSAADTVRVCSPEIEKLAHLLQQRHVTVRLKHDGALEVEGMPSDQMGIIEAHDGMTLDELSTTGASLEEAYMALTDSSVNYRPPPRTDPAHDREHRRPDTPGGPIRHGCCIHRVTFGRVVTAEWIKIRTLRSTVAVLAGAMLGMIMMALIVATSTPADATAPLTGLEPAFRCGRGPRRV